MEDNNKEPMVTITLGEYNRLRDKSNDIMRMYERMNGMDNMIRDMDRRLMNVEHK